MIDLESRLVDLGEALDLDDSDDLVDGVLAGLDRTESEPPTHSMPWRAAAVILVVAVVAVLAVPGARRTVAEWFGLTGVEIERRPELSIPAGVPPAASTVTAPVDVDVTVTTVVVDAFDVGEFDGRLDEAVISKALAPGTGIEWVTVGDRPGLWIDGEPHLVAYRSPDGAIVTERFAGNTLLWQDGDVIRRVEGFPTLDAALAFAATMGT
ncbi:MAG TPA: hypothetical protein VNQ73_19810 [Ilumatobacter sp.]|nr:hypothetical protein [Ilumatobacter sp.]